MKTLKTLFLRCTLICVTMLCPLLVFAQTGQVNLEGVVVDQKGNPVAGASVMVKGTLSGTITDESGNFSITADHDSVLEFSFLGFQSREIAVSTVESPLKVVLLEDSEFLDEVVVVGFGVQKKVNLTGSVGSVDMDKVLKNRPLGDVGATLQGAMPGLQITSSNAVPGTAPSFNIRGYTSINGGSPLVLVDNVPMDLSMVDPADIENVSVLKDASSAAIYGARAAYGVILVTTKKGESKDRIKVSYNNNFAFSQAYNLPVKASPYDEVMAYKASGMVNSSRLGCNVDKWLDLLKDYEANPDAYPEGYTYDELGQLYPLKENDLIGLMMDDFGFQHKHNISMQGVIGKNSYRLSLGMIDEDGILYTDKDRYRRYNVSAYWKAEPVKWLDVSADIKYADSYRSYVADGGIRYGLYGSAINMSSYAIIEPGEVDGQTYLPEIARSYLTLAEPLKQKDRTMRMLGVVNLKPFKGLTITGEYSYMYGTNETNDYRNRFYYQELNRNLRENRANSSYSMKKGSDIWNTLNVYATYSREIDGHEFSVMGGYNQESKDSESVSVSRLDVIASELPSIVQSTGVMESEDSYSGFATRSLFYRLNYAYKGKYLFETNGRYDGSSRFPKNHRFGFFPSASLAWRLSEENFIKQDWLDNLKLRASIGTIGNQSIANYAFIPTMDAYLGKWLVGGKQVTTLEPPALVSSNFTWETVVTYDLGLDMRLWDRLTATFDYYVRDTKDMLTKAMELPSVLGTSAPKENAADLRTRGWELEIQWRDRIGELDYNIGFNLYDSRTFITKFDNEVGLLSSKYVGQEIGEIWGYETAGFYTDDHFDDAGNLKPGVPKVEGFNPNPGDILYVDKNHDGIINQGKNTLSDPGDRVVIGNNQRRYQYAISGGLGWKGIDFSFILTGIGKRDLWQSNEMIFPMYTAFASVMANQLDYWTPENTDAFYPRLYEEAKGNTEANRYCQTRYLLDGSYLKIKNISLGYTFPEKIVRKLHISSLSVFFSGENLYTFYKTPEGVNPESESSELGWYYPEMRKFSFGISLTL